MKFSYGEFFIYNRFFNIGNYYVLRGKFRAYFLATAAVIAAATIAEVIAAAVTAPATAAEQEQQNDDDPEAAAAVVTTVIVTHMEYLLRKLRSFPTSVHLMREGLWCDNSKKES